MPINVIIADDQAAHLSQLRKYWERALGPGPRYDMTTEIAQVEQKLTARPHVLILDNQFAEAANEGATFIAKHKEAHPDTLFVLMTGNGFDIEQLGQRTPNPDFIVPKSYLLGTPYQAYIGGAIRGALRRSSANVSVPPDGIEEIGVSRDAFTSLVEQCICSLEVLDFDMRSEPTVSFKLLSGGYSGAAVYQMSVKGAGRTPALPLVFKCGKREQISREIRAFERWVRWQLPHDMRVDVIGRGVTGDHAAVCYGFVLGSSDQLTSLADVLRTGDRETFEKSLERIFFAERTGWYGAPRQEDRTLCSYMLDQMEFNPAKDERRNNRFKAVLLDLAKSDDFDCVPSSGDLVVFGRSFGSIRRAVTSVDGRPAQLTYCHGDLNANNIFLDLRYDGLALIDFEMSGESHLFRDFVSIETSARMDLPNELTQTLSFEELVATEMAQMSAFATETDDDYSSWIQFVRRLATRRFVDAEPSDYLVPLVLHSWKVLGIKSWPRETERRLAAVILAGMEHLGRLRA